MALPLPRDQIVREVKLDALRVLKLVASGDLVWTWNTARRAGLLAGTMHTRVMGYLENTVQDGDAEMRLTVKGRAYLERHGFRLEITKFFAEQRKPSVA
jgi:hypothetical protein